MAWTVRGTAADVALCLSNSLGWYETIFRTHGLSSTVKDGVWASRGEAPPYYSNAVTLAPAWSSAQAAVVRDLAAALGRSFTIKDSFATIDLEAGGMRLLFEAAWILRDPAAAPPVSDDRAARWHRVTNAPALERWEAAWRSNGSPTTRRVFLSALLADPEVALFAAYRGGRIVGGCAANRTPGAVGLSNIFAEERDRETVAAAALAETIRFAPGLPVVGYDRGEDLDRLVRLGFRPVGPLRVVRVEALPPPIRDSADPAVTRA